MSIPKTLISASVALLAFTTSANALGCYSGGLLFDELHGGKDQELHGEVLMDINTQCQAVDNAIFKKGDPAFYRCTEWAVTVDPDSTCYDNCADGCAATANSGGRGGELSAGFCGLGCDPNCGGPAVGSINHIIWEIHHDNDDAESTMTWEMCNKAFETEAGGCSSGSEQHHEGFWYKIDPQSGPCP